MQDNLDNKLSGQIIGSAIKVHKALGSGMVEKIYQRALYLELKKSGLKFEREKRIAIKYNNVIVGYQIVDFVVEGKVLIEVKAVSGLDEVQIGQVVTYLHATKIPLGLILNFGKSKLEIKRVKI
ncbi:MAG: GxxExxY protein [Patescibacteria group bacterium]